MLRKSQSSSWEQSPKALIWGWTDHAMEGTVQRRASPINCTPPWFISVSLQTEIWKVQILLSSMKWQDHHWTGAEHTTQTMLLWHIDYFELKAIDKQQIWREGSLTSPFYLNTGHSIATEKGTLPALGRECSYPWRLGVDAGMDLYKQTNWNNPDLPLVSPISFPRTVPQYNDPAQAVQSHCQFIFLCVKRS